MEEKNVVFTYKVLENTGLSFPLGLESIDIADAVTALTARAR